MYEEREDDEGKKLQSCPKPAKIAAELTAANVPKLSDTGTSLKKIIISDWLI